MSRPYTYADRNTTEILSIISDGVFERKKQFDDISKMGEYAISI